MERRQLRHAETARHRKVEVVEVPVDDVELVGLRGDLLELDDHVRERVDDGLVEPERAAACDATSRALVFESPLANSVTSWPSRTSSSVRFETTRSVPP